jgi:hypothetical protein
MKNSLAQANKGINLKCRDGIIIKNAGLKPLKPFKFAVDLAKFISYHQFMGTN